MERKGAPLCVGLDPMLDRLPPELRGEDPAGAYERFCRGIVDAVTDTLKSRGEVTFTGFGKFSTSERKARMGVNPRNPSEKVHIPAATVPKFSAGSGLKSAVKSGGSSY